MGEFDSSRRSFLLGLGAAPLAAAWAQEGDPARRAWSARWIRVPEAPPKEWMASSSGAACTAHWRPGERL
jgi:hypothetical protein